MSSLYALKLADKNTYVHASAVMLTRTGDARTMTRTRTKPTRTRTRTRFARTRT